MYAGNVMDKIFKGSVLVIGLGLIGGSVAKGLKDNHFATRIMGFDLSNQTIKTAVSMGVIDEGVSCLKEASQQADLIIVATPVLSVLAVMKSIAPYVKKEAILTDVGSVKGVFVKAYYAVFGQDKEYRVRCVPAHPIAGAESSGVESADARLFEHHRLILTPLDNHDDEAVSIVTALWVSLGADVVDMDVNVHDDVLARTSHLPHLLAFSLVSSLANEDKNVDIFEFAAGGFRDFTRIAESDPQMWHDIFLANKESVLDALHVFQQNLKSIEKAIESENSEVLLNQFSTAQRARRHFSALIQTNKKT